MTQYVDLQSDFSTVLNSMRMGLRGVADPDNVGCYLNIADEHKEYERKVRTVLRGICVLMRSLPLVNPFQHKPFAWQLLNHRLCRWLVPFAMVAPVRRAAYFVLVNTSIVHARLRYWPGERLVLWERSKR